MPIFRTDDPAADFARYDAEQEAWLSRRPVCVHCNKPIQDERLWDINGEIYHDECAKSEFKKWSEDYIE